MAREPAIAAPPPGFFADLLAAFLHHSEQLRAIGRLGRQCRAQTVPLPRFSLVMRLFCSARKITSTMDAPPIQYVKTSDGFDIAYSECGRGRAVVLLPGGTNNLQFMWQQQPAFRTFFEAMANRYRFIQFDGRGSGLSSRGLGPNYAMQDRRLDFQAVVERLHLDRFCLIAPAETCHIAVPYAIEHPERVDGLVLWNPGWNQSERGTLLPYEELVRRSWELCVRTMAAGGVGDIELEERRIRESVTPEDFITWVNAVLKLSLRPVLPSLNVPTLVLGIRNSPVHPTTEGSWRAVAGLIPNARLVLFDDGRSIGGLTAASDDPPAAVAMINFFEGLTSDEAYAKTANRGLHGLLSGREVEVLRLVAAGKSNQQIADELVISLNTVRRHVSNVFDKTGVGNRAQAGAYARDHGIA
jgi:DNA-binding CsgD family transcriptional regulator/pimeloyl-ACP methyl ester carboxylesterase